jgi:hypothetical protein
MEGGAISMQQQKQDVWFFYGKLATWGLKLIFFKII